MSVSAIDRLVFSSSSNRSALIRGSPCIASVLATMAKILYVNSLSKH